MSSLQPRTGLSPYGPHVSGNLTAWSCDGIDPFAFSGSSWTCYGIMNACSCNDFSCQHSSSFFDRQLSKEDAHWSCGQYTTTGKDLLREDVDDEWLDLEHNLNSILDDELDTSTETAVVGNDGKRDITSDAIHTEMKRFSGVLRLKTLMDIFKVDSFDRTVEFFDNFKIHGSTAHDPLFGVMAIFKKHLYVPARKMKEIREERRLNMNRKSARPCLPKLPKVVVVEPVKRTKRKNKKRTKRCATSSARSLFDAVQSGNTWETTRRPVLQPKHLNALVSLPMGKGDNVSKIAAKTEPKKNAWTVVPSPKRTPDKENATPLVSSASKTSGKQDNPFTPPAKITKKWNVVPSTKSKSSKGSPTAKSPAKSPATSTSPPLDRARLGWRGKTLVL